MKRNDEVLLTKVNPGPTETTNADVKAAHVSAADCTIRKLYYDTFRSSPLKMEFLGTIVHV